MVGGLIGAWLATRVPADRFRLALPLVLTAVWVYTLWRKDLGQEAEAGIFLGRADHWRRISETWPDPNLDDPELGTEMAMRLLDYIEALEPARNPVA